MSSAGHEGYLLKGMLKNEVLFLGKAMKTSFLYSRISRRIRWKAGNIMSFPAIETKQKIRNYLKFIWICWENHNTLPPSPWPCPCPVCSFAVFEHQKVVSSRALGFKSSWKEEHQQLMERPGGNLQCCHCDIVTSINEEARRKETHLWGYK